MTRRTRLILLGALIAGALALALIRPVAAHDWYENACCSDKDCAPIDAAAVGEDAAGTTVTFAGGQHPQLPAGMPARTWRVTESQKRPSRDGRYHACIAPGGARLICLYVPLSS